MQNSPHRAGKPNNSTIWFIYKTQHITARHQVKIIEKTKKMKNQLLIWIREVNVCNKTLSIAINLVKIKCMTRRSRQHDIIDTMIGNREMEGERERERERE